jgi:hypothetical protein
MNEIHLDAECLVLLPREIKANLGGASESIRPAMSSDVFERQERFCGNAKKVNFHDRVLTGLGGRGRALSGPDLRQTLADRLERIGPGARRSAIRLGAQAVQWLPRTHSLHRSQGDGSIWNA